MQACRQAVSFVIGCIVMFCGTTHTGHHAIVNDDEHAGREPLLDVDDILTS